MRLAQSKLQKVKLGLHSIQGFLIFIAACITISVLSKTTKSDGRLGWYFAVCFLTIPALIYQTAVPMWSRSVRFANAYAFAAVDVLFSIFWLSAFAAIMAWNRSGILEGAAAKKIDQSQANCTDFAYGTDGACRLGYTQTAFGVIIFLIFAGAGAISIMYVQRLRQNTTADDPWLAAGGSSQTYARAGGAEDGDGNKDNVWDPSTGEIDNPFNHEDDAEATEMHSTNYDEENQRYGGDRRSSRRENEYGSMHSTETGDGQHPGQQVQWGPTATMPRVDTEYRGGYNSYQDPSALSPAVHERAGAAADLPEYEERANSGRRGSGGPGFSFS